MPATIHFKPLGTNVLIDPCKDDETTTPGGLVVPQAVMRGNKLSVGIIKAKGNGNRFNDMTTIIVDNRVYFKHGTGIPQTVNGKEMLIVDFSSLLFVE